MKFIDLKSLGQPHEWEEFDYKVRQCVRCGEIQRFDISRKEWYMTLRGIEDICGDRSV